MYHLYPVSYMFTNKQVIYEYDGAIQTWIANLISNRAAPYFSTIRPWRMKILLNDFWSRLVSKPCYLRRNESQRSLFFKSTLHVQILAYLTSWDI